MAYILLCVSHLLILTLHCSIRLHLQKTDSKIKFLRISRQSHQKGTTLLQMLHVQEAGPGLGALQIISSLLALVSSSI